VVPESEDAEDYKAFEAAIIADYCAETAVARELVLRLASLLWRLRRVTAIETQLFEINSASFIRDETYDQKLNQNRDSEDVLPVPRRFRSEQPLTCATGDCASKDGVLDFTLNLPISSGLTLISLKRLAN
jgi:hypothetical protein